MFSGERDLFPDGSVLQSTIGSPDGSDDSLPGTAVVAVKAAYAPRARVMPTPDRVEGGTLALAGSALSPVAVAANRVERGGGDEAASRSVPANGKKRRTIKKKKSAVVMM